jgi:hypothetical protein
VSSGPRLVVLTFALAGLGAAPPFVGPFDTNGWADAGPKLVTARYRATFADGSLTGTVAWEVANAAPGEATWAFAPPRVALGELTWDGGDPARIARLPADRLAIPVPATGGTLSGEWSARSAEERGARRFEFRFPVAPIATFDLTLPTPIRPVARPEDALRTGPFPADDPGRRRWRFSFGGRDRLAVVIPAPATRTTPDPGPVTRASRWVVGAGRADGTVTLTPERPFVAWDDVTLTVDPTARVTGVTCDGPCEWAVDPPAAGRPSHRLRVRPLDPDGVTRVAVALRADPPGGDEAWAVPVVRPARLAPADDTIVIRADDSVRVANWDPGDYRMDSIEANDAGERSVRFEGTFAHAAGPDRRPPRLTVVAPPPDVSVAERATFTVDPRSSRLHVVATVAVRRGPVSALRVTAPAPYRLAVAPSLSRDDGALHPDPLGPTADIPFARPLGSGQSVTVTLSLVAATSAARDGLVRLAVPAVTWDATERTGTVTVRPSSAFSPVPPLVVAYQDGPPPGDLVLALAPKPATPGPERAEKPTFPEQTSPGTLHSTVRVGRNGLDVTIRGTTPAEVSLPLRMALESVRVADRWRDVERPEGRPLIIPAGPRPGSTFEVRGRVAEPDAHFGPIRTYSHAGFPGETEWVAEPDVVLRHANGTAWALRTDAIDATVRFVSVAVLAVALVALRRGHRGATGILFLTAAGFGAVALFGTARDEVALPVTVALAGLALAHVVPRRALALLAFAFVTATSPARALPPVVVTNATYRMSEGADDVTVTATWDVSARGPGPMNASLPLMGANVSAVRLDGTPAFTDSLPAGGFGLPVEPGDRRVEATFVVPVRRIGADREIRFDGPDVPRGSLTFEASPGTSAVSVASRRGRQVTDGALTSADLGEGRSVVVRWRPATVEAPASAAEPTLEATVIDTGDGPVVATAGVVFPPSRAGRPFALRVPEGWGIDRVTVRRAGAIAVVPADWALDGPVLTVTPRAPVEGRVAVHVALTPLAPTTAIIDIPVVRATENPDPHSLLVVRLDGVTMTRWHKTGAVDWPADAAAKRLSDVGLESSRPIAVAARRSDGPYAVSVGVAPVPTFSAVTQRLSWTLGRRGDATAEISAGGTGVTFVVSIPPAVRDPRFRGVEVRGGRRADGSYELVRPADVETGIRWAGSVGDLGPGEHELPVPPGTVTVRIRPAPGWVVRVLPGPGVSTLSNDPETFAVGPGVNRIRAILSAENPTVPPPAPVPPSLPSPPVLPEVIPVARPTAAPPSVPSALPFVAWLAGLGGVAAVGQFGRGRFRPECVIGLGVLGWVAVGPAFVSLVVVGLVLRLIRTVLVV